MDHDEDNAQHQAEQTQDAGEEHYWETKHPDGDARRCIAAS